MWETNLWNCFDRNKQRTKKKQLQSLINNLHSEWSNGKICCNTYFKNNITKENKTKGDESIEKLKERIPQMSKYVCNALSKFQKVINKIRKNKNKDV